MKWNKSPIADMHHYTGVIHDYPNLAIIVLWSSAEGVWNLELPDGRERKMITPHNANAYEVFAWADEEISKMAIQ